MAAVGMVMIVAGVYPLATAAEELHLLSSWSPAYVGRPEIVGHYVDLLQRHAEGEMAVRVAGPETIPPFEQLEPVAAGLFDILFTHGAYHVGETGVGVALGAVKAGPELRRTSGLWAMIDMHYRAHGLKLLSLPTSARGYHLLLKDALGASCDLVGRKIRGSPVYHGLIRSLGATPVVLPAGEIYSALEKQVIDGAAWPAAGSLPFRWYEVTRYYSRPTFGATTHLLLINLERFQAMGAVQQGLLLKAGELLERDVHTRFDELVAIEESAFNEHGLQQTHFCDQSLTQLEKSWADGAWALGIEKSGDSVRRLQALARETGLAD